MYAQKRRLILPGFKATGCVSLPVVNRTSAV